MPGPAPALLDRLAGFAATAFADGDEALAATLGMARDLLGLSTALVARVEDGAWRVAHVRDDVFGLAPGDTLPIEDTFCEHVVGRVEPLLVNDAPNDPFGCRVPATYRFGIRTYIGVPLALRDGRVVGTLCALDKRAGALGDSQVRVLEVVARFAIGELERAETVQQRASQERRFAALVEHSSDLITVLDVDLVRRYVSPSSRSVLGYEPSELLDGRAQDLHHPDDAARVRELFADLATRPGASDRLELRVRHRDGTIRWLDVVATNRFDDPDIRGFVLNSRDVTARKAAEEALAVGESERRQSTAIFRAFMDHSSALAFMKDEHGRYAYVNATMERLFGVEAVAMRGKTDLDFLPPATAAHVGAHDAYVLHRWEPIQTVENVPAPDGEPRHWLTTKFPFRGADGRRFVGGVAFDITARIRAESELRRANAALETEIGERRLAEAELRRSDERFVKAFRASPAAIAIATVAEDRIIDANDAFAALTGWHRVGAIGRTAADLGLWGASPGAGEQIRAAIAEGGSARDLELRLTTRTGEVRTILASIEPLQVAGESCLLNVFRDVTREREVDRMKTEFVSLVSHELRTPLTSIRGYVDLLLDGEAGDLTAEQQEFLGIARANTVRLTKLINDLLDLSRLEAGRVDLSCREVDLATLVREAATSLRPQVEIKRQRLAVELPPDLPHAWGDGDRLAQVVANLLSNAHKYTPAGGTIVVRGGVLPEEGLVRIEVRDNGVGLTPDEQAHLFSRFYRARNRATQDIGGTGLGLAIVRSLVELHGGQVTVASLPDRGSTFAFTVPIAARRET